MFEFAPCEFKFMLEFTPCEFKFTLEFAFKFAIKFALCEFKFEFKEFFEFWLKNSKFSSKISVFSPNLPPNLSALHEIKTLAKSLLIFSNCHSIRLFALKSKKHLSTPIRAERPPARITQGISLIILPFCLSDILQQKSKKLIKFRLKYHYEIHRAFANR